MTTNNRIVQIVAAGIVFLLLAAIGIVTFDTAGSLTKLEETLNTPNPGLVENPGQPVATAKPSVNNVTDVSNSDPAGQSGDAGNVSGGASGDANGGNAPFEVVLPSDNTVYLSSLSTSIQLQLKADASVTASNISARLLILKRVFSATEKETLPQGFSSDEVKLESFQPPTVNIIFNFQEIPPTGKYEGLLIVTGEGITPISKLLTIEVTDFPADDANLANFVKLAIHLPSTTADDKTMIVSRDLRQMVFQLENLDNEKNATVTAQLVIAKSIDGTNETVIGGYASPTANVELKPFETKNVTLDLGDHLPPSGTYAAWLVVRGDASQTVMEKLTLIVSADPQVAIQSRLTNAAEGEKSITIGGLRNYPTWTAPVFGLVFGPVVTVPGYDLTLWEANLQAANCTLIPSELADKANGRTGILSVDNTTPCEKMPVTVKLTPSSITYPGSYTGTLRIIIPSAVQNEVIPVTVLVRDRLIWPALVIFFGALVAGYAVRFALGEGRKNVAYLRYQIKQAQILAEKPGVGPKIKDEVQIYLDLAGLNLDINDLDSASKYIKQAYEKLGYDLSAERAPQEQPNARTTQLEEEEKELKRLKGRVKLVGRASTIVWALIATIAGLVYIDSRLPTFGSPQDYILALAWALGLSSAAQPAEKIAAGILKSLAGQDQQVNDGQDDPAKKTDQQPVQNTDEIVVPLVVKKSQDEATKILEDAGLKPIFKPDGSPKEWVVKDPTDPKAGKKVKKGETVTCTLIPQKADGDGNTGDDPGVHGSVP